MMRRIGRGLAVMLAAVLAAAWAEAAMPQRPAEEPPADFAGRQYIDSTGCVFLRDGRRWAPRLARDGAPVCGYPPTPVGRADPPSLLPDAAPVPLDGMGRIEAELVTVLAANTAPGDWTGSGPAEGDRRPAPQASAPEDGAGLTRIMADAIAVSPGMGRAAAAVPGTALNPNPRLCALLGMGAGDTAHVLGGDPTGGFCSGLVAPGLSPRVAEAEGTAASPTAPERAGPARPRQRDAGRQAPGPRRIAAEAARPAPAAPAKARADRPAAPASLNGLIPAGTRFLQVGRYPDAAEAEAALRRIMALGLPVARSRGADRSGGRTIMAGPFGTREAVVRAHDRLTRAGFRGLVPRR